jgi:CO dehydrogenase maturation factor
MMKNRPIFAICGKGGVGKTVFSALFARSLKTAGVKPLLLIDADPAGGLVSAIGEKIENTLAGGRDQLIASARKTDRNTRQELARQLDYFVLQALVERSDYSLLAMGRSREKGCFCPANTLLREAIDFISDPFAAILIDAEAGLEQIQRRVTRNVTQVIAVSDGSQRSRDIIEFISEMVGYRKLAAVINRVRQKPFNRPNACRLLGSIPEDATLRQFDQDGKSLWDLPADNPACIAVEKITEQLGFRISTNVP